MIQRLNHDVLELSGPALIERQELYDFVVAELRLREGIGRKKIQTLHKPLQNQRDDILGFTQVLDDKLLVIADRLDRPLYWVRQMYLCFRKQPTSQAYWQVGDFLQQKHSWKFHSLYEAAMKQTPRASSLVDKSPKELMTGESHPHWLEMVGFKRFQQA